MDNSGEPLEFRDPFLLIPKTSMTIAMLDTRT